MRRRALAPALLALLWPAMASAKAPPPVPTRKVDVVEQLHGVAVADPHGDSR